MRMHPICTYHCFLLCRSVDLSPALGALNCREWFDCPQNPVHIDIGCARGRCIERLASRYDLYIIPLRHVCLCMCVCVYLCISAVGDSHCRVFVRPERVGWNHVGVEIRPSVVQEALERVRAGGGYVDDVGHGGERDTHTPRRNIHFLAGNFVTSAEDILGSFAPGTVRMVSIQVIEHSTLVAVADSRMISLGASVYVSVYVSAAVPGPLEKEEASQETACAASAGQTARSTPVPRSHSLPV